MSLDQLKTVVPLRVDLRGEPKYNLAFDAELTNSGS